MNQLLRRLPHDQVHLIGGHARSGADKLVRRYAKQYGYKYTGFPADWDGPYRKGAGFKRNDWMSTVITHLVAFWDFKSSGTKHMIELTQDENSKIITQVYRVAVPTTQ